MQSARGEGVSLYDPEGSAYLISATGPHGHTLKIRPPLPFGRAHAGRLLSVLSDVPRTYAWRLSQRSPLLVPGPGTAHGGLWQATVAVPDRLTRR